MNILSWIYLFAVQPVEVSTVIRNCLQSLLLILSELSQFINFIPPWNHQRTYGFLMISGGIEVN